ncbi:MAG: hypothetical protein WC816_02705 [Sphingomonas sp.]|jgi:hypothetical protein
MAKFSDVNSSFSAEYPPAGTVVIDNFHGVFFYGLSSILNFFRLQEHSYYAALRDNIRGRRRASISARAIDAGLIVAIAARDKLRCAKNSSRQIKTNPGGSRR